MLPHKRCLLVPAAAVTPRVPALTLPRLEMEFCRARTGSVLTGCGCSRKDPVASHL